MSRQFLISASLVLLLLQLSCNTNPVDPPIKDPRDYTWTIDTLAYPNSDQTLMFDIWGSNPGDVYTVGHNERAGGRMWHYNRTSWTPVKLTASEGGPFIGIGILAAIHGFNFNDIFVAGERVYLNTNPPPFALDSSLVIHYNGSTWQEIAFERHRVFQSVWGRNPHDIWFGGINGTIYHYDGITMKKDSVPVFIPKDADPFYNFISITGSQNMETYTLLHAPNTPEGETRYWVLKHQGSKWAVIDSNFYFGRELWVSPSGSLYAVGFGAHRLVGNSWQNLHLEDFSAGDITGTADDNFFVVGTIFQDNTFHGLIYHYDGSSWHKFTNLSLPDAILNAVWTDGREVFAVGHTNGFPQVSIVVHGK